MIPHLAVRPDVLLGPMTTYKVGGPARWYAEPQDLEELRSILEVTPDDVAVWVLGRGSNVVISDAGFDGLVLRLSGGGFTAIDIRPDGDVVAGGGTALPVLARAAADAGRGGLEFYVGIPGSVGGAVVMNAGGHGSETADVLVEATVLHLTHRDLVRVPPGDLDLSYRHSSLTGDDVVVQARFRTSERDPDEARAELRAITRWRKEHQPGGTLNAGSVFKNPPSEAAGAIIDRLGLKGTGIGPVSVSELHGNWMVATPSASATDIHAFVHHIRHTVHERTGILLEPEVRFIGAFPDREAA